MIVSQKPFLKELYVYTLKVYYCVIRYCELLKVFCIVTI